MSINKERQIERQDVLQRRATRYEASESARATLVHQFGERVRIADETPPTPTARELPVAEVTPLVASIVHEELTGIEEIRQRVEAASRQGDMSYDLPEAL